MQLNSAVNTEEVAMCGKVFPLNVWDESQDVVMGPTIAIDTETELIVDHNFPPLVLLQVTAGRRVDLVPYTKAAEYMRLLLRYNPNSLYVFVNAAFDMGVLNEPGLYDMVDKGCVVNLQDRYKLWEIAERGFVRKPDSLANMARNVLSETLAKDEDIRLGFKRDKPMTVPQLVYGAADVVATWLLAERIPAMPSEADSQIMGGIVLDAIARNGLLVDRPHFDKIRAEFKKAYADDLEYLELQGYNPLLGKPSTAVLRDGLAALGIEDIPEGISGPKLEYLLYRSLSCQSVPLEQFKENVQQALADIEAESCVFLSQRDAVDWYVEDTQASFDGKLKRDRLVQARKAAKATPPLDIMLKAQHQRINPFKSKHRKRLDELVRDMLDAKFIYDDGLREPFVCGGLGLKDMARDKKLCMWPMASVLRELYKAKAGKLNAIPEYSFKALHAYITTKATWYGNYSTEWADCLKPGKFMQMRLLSIEQKNPDITFPRTKGGKNGDKKELQVSAKDKWIFKKFGLEDTLIETYISYKKNEKRISTYLNPDNIKADGRVHTRFENYVRTGRTSSAKPNIQNVPGSGGIRQMYIPKPMHLFASVDYSQLELCSLAQHCYTVFGYSRMRELINADIDLHSWFAAKDIGLLKEEDDYDGTEESRLRVIEILKEVPDKKRKNAKACYSADTELLTRSGWQHISEVYGTDTEIAQYCPHTKQLTFVKPLGWVRKKNQVLVNVVNDYTDALVTPDHRMLRISRAGVVSEVHADALEPNEQYSQVHGGQLDASGPQLSPEATRLAVMVQADGSFQGTHCRLGFTKARKIDRCALLLQQADISYHRSIDSSGVTVFRFKRSALSTSLTAGKNFLQWDRYYAAAFIDELPHWDGSVHARTKNTVCYTNTSKADVDVAQTILVTNGYKTGGDVQKDTTGSNRKPCWRLTWYRGAGKQNPEYGRTSGLRKTEVEGTHTVYCPSVPTSWVLTRRNNKVLVSGNCNFGFPGGMQESTFLRTQRGYGNIDITIEECGELRNNWFMAFPEMNDFMKPESDFVTDYDRIRMDNPNLRLHKSFNIMGVIRRKCTFNSACNYPFQSLAALGAKRALWAVWRDGRYAKYMVNFIHDEILFELPAETAANDVREIQKIMEAAMREVIPDVRIEAEGCLMERWDKEAKPVFDAFGNLTVWYPKEDAA